MSRPLVLVVDDDALLRRGLVRALRRRFDVCDAANGEDGLALLAAEPVRALVSDIWMPGMDGFALVEAAWRSRPDLAVLLITGMLRREHVARAQDLGVHAVLKKPIAGPALRDAVAAALAMP